MGRKDDVPESPMLCLPNSEVKGLLIKWNPQPRAIAYELRYRFRRLDNLFWGAWISMSNAIEATKILLPARKDAVYCFQVRAKTADKGWGAWSDSSAVLRSTSTGGLEYAASVELDGSMAKSLEEQKKQHSEKTAHESATPRRPFAAAPSSSSSSLSSSIFVVRYGLDAAELGYWRRMLFGVTASSSCDVYTDIIALISGLASLLGHDASRPLR